ncbi:MAG: hypothetical protein IPH53_12585 [Flavobacteriales bacterium]|nr:hypothetical protein [Flavobacteriales bacterium]
MKTLYLAYKVVPWLLTGFFATWHMLRPSAPPRNSVAHAGDIRTSASPCETTVSAPSEPYTCQSAPPSWVCSDVEEHRLERLDHGASSPGPHVYFGQNRKGERHELLQLDGVRLRPWQNMDAECLHEVMLSASEAAQVEPDQQRVPAHLHASLELPAEPHAAKESEATYSIRAAALSDADNDLREGLMRRVDNAAYSRAEFVVPDGTVEPAILFTDPALNSPSINWDSLEQAYRRAKLMELAQLIDSLVKANTTRIP